LIIVSEPSAEAARRQVRTGRYTPVRSRSSVAHNDIPGTRTHRQAAFTPKRSASAVPPSGVRGGAQFGSRSCQAAIGRVRSADRFDLRIHVPRTVADIVSNSYGSEGSGVWISLGGRAGPLVEVAGAEGGERSQRLTWPSGPSGDHASPMASGGGRVQSRPPDPSICNPLGSVSLHAVPRRHRRRVLSLRGGRASRFFGNLPLVDNGPMAPPRAFYDSRPPRAS
jgi:hypothetical protein